MEYEGPKGFDDSSSLGLLGSLFDPFIRLLHDKAFGVKVVERTYTIHPILSLGRTNSSPAVHHLGASHEEVTLSVVMKTASRKCQEVSF